MTDQVPFGIVQIAQRARLAEKFLHPILAEDPQTGGISLADACDRKSLAHSHQRDFFWIAARSTRCCRDPLSHQRNTFRDRHRKKNRNRARRTRSIITENSLRLEPSTSSGP